MRYIQDLLFVRVDQENIYTDIYTDTAEAAALKVAIIILQF